MNNYDIAALSKGFQRHLELENIHNNMPKTFSHGTMSQFRDIVKKKLEEILQKLKGIVKDL